MPGVAVPEAGSASRDAELRSDPRWQLIQRIVASPHLAKSSRLCGFLQFVAAETLQGRASELNEQRIGVHVFERKLDYDSADDNIVRSHASRLRQRIEAYFLHGGQSEPIRVTLPRGGYVPLFEAVAKPVEPALQAIEAENKPAAQAEAITPRTQRSYVATAVLAVLLVFATAIAVWQTVAHHQLLARTRTVSPVMHALWSEIFVPGRQTFLVPADSSLVLYENLTESNVPLSNYLDKSYLSGPAAIPSETPTDIARRFAHRRLTSVADIELVTKLLHIPEAAGNPPVLRFARDLQVDDLKGANGVLVGAKESNPWVAMFEAHRNFVIDDDQKARRFTVLNRSPQAGEEAAYYSQAEDPQHRAYAAIALVPNLDNSGLVLLVEGTSIAGTEAATDYLFGNPSQIEPLLGPAFKQYGRIPAFEVLLETTNLNGSAPLSHVVAVRVKP